MNLNEFYALFRDADCKFCGISNCRTFARRVILGKAEISGCANISGETKEKIAKALKEGIAFSNLPKLETTGAIILRPCKKRGKKTGEIRLHNPNNVFPLFDSKALYDIVLKADGFRDVSYSEELSFLRASLGEKNVFIFESGLIRVKQADSKADIERTVELLKGLIKRAEICEACGGTREECGERYCGKSSA